MPRAFGYIRVSKEDQKRSGLGLEAQRAAIRTRAESLGLELATIYEDAAFSGGLDPDKRPALVDALAALGRGDTLIVAKRDRLSRGDPVAVAMAEREAARRKARIVSAAGEGTDGDAPADVLQRRIIDAFAEHERLIIAARVRAALQVKRARGERAGYIPLGFRLSEDGRTLLADAAEQAAIARVRALRAEGLSFASVIARLEVEGLRPSPRFDRAGNRLRGGERWHRTTLRRICEPANA